jgi:ribose 5-phosphate isomerase B
VRRGEAMLQVKDLLGLLLGGCVTQPRQPQHSGQVRPVLLEDRRVLRLVVVRLVGQAESGLVQVDHVSVGFETVGVDPEGHRAGAAGPLQSSQERCQLLAVRDPLDRRELIADRREPEGFDALDVHEALVEAAHLRRDAGSVRPSAELGDDVAHLLLGLVVQPSGDPVHRPVGRDLVAGDPVSVHVSVEVVLRSDGVVEGGDVDAAVLGCHVSRLGGGWQDGRMRIHIAADHAGFELKEYLAEHLRAGEHEVTDHGAHAYDPEDDYPQYCFAAAEAVVADPGSIGIVIGGSGNGEQIAANKVPGVRAALVWNTRTAGLARTHNDANVIALGGRLHSVDAATEMIEEFLGAAFSGEPRHQRRIDQLAAYEARA